jgi:NADPH:quinone reductase-like Zn-dependent oxidoreductase
MDAVHRPWYQTEAEHSKILGGAAVKLYELRGGFGLDALHLAERPRPDPGANQVLVKVRATSLNYRDLMVVKGQYNPKMALPRIPLSDMAGVVESLGAGVTRVAVGQRVAGLFMPAWTEGALDDARARSALGGAVDGVLAEYVVLPEDAVVPVPEHLSDEEAATLPCAGVTAWNAIVEGGVRAGDSVLVQGTGGVSLFALQFAKMPAPSASTRPSTTKRLPNGPTAPAS